MLRLDAKQINLLSIISNEVHLTYICVVALTNPSGSLNVDSNPPVCCEAYRYIAPGMAELMARALALMKVLLLESKTTLVTRSCRYLVQQREIH